MKISQLRWWNPPPIMGAPTPVLSLSSQSSSPEMAGGATFSTAIAAMGMPAEGATPALASASVASFAKALPAPGAAREATYRQFTISLF